MTGEELIDFVNNDLFPALQKLASSAGVSPRGKVIGSVFEDAYNYMKSGTLLRQVINTIEQDLDFNSSDDRHVFNDIYEKILADLHRRGMRRVLYAACGDAVYGGYFESAAWGDGARSGLWNGGNFGLYD